jgi:hypothetical protein
MPLSFGRESSDETILRSQSLNSTQPPGLVCACLVYDVGHEGHSQGVLGPLTRAVVQAVEELDDLVLRRYRL